MGKKFCVEIKIENDSFAEVPQFEVARILNTIAKKLDENDFVDYRDDNGFLLFDSNGNKCGKAFLKREE